MTLATPLTPPYPVPAEPQWLDSVEALDAWLDEYRHEPLALDTEFERVSTFYPIPGLVQLGAGDSLRLAEPAVAAGSAGFREALADPRRGKLLYAMGEDLELFRHWLKLEPRGLLDLQLGAALAGAGFSVGYARLVEEIFGETLDKSATRSNWLARPLSDAQQRYALDDVRFLAPLHQWIAERLEERGLTDALGEESERFAIDLLAFSEPGDAYLKLRGGWHLAGPNQQVLKVLVAWREEECRRRDRPRSRVLADAALIGIAERLPQSSGALSAVDGVPPVVVRRFGDTLLTLIQDALESGEEPESLIDRPLSRPQQDLYRKVKKQMARAAEQWDVPVELLAPRKKLEALLRSSARAPEALEAFASGWRGRVLAPVLDDLRKLIDEQAPNNE